ncbi:cytochrome ubiquinol oxidase subunit I [Ligilactobacillus salivarius]|uniref:cytochrome ubiquinol oxidase subunit I n=1 Tax=Ligilactobacillus salivarius TaxID=1624 RepID=UPI00195DCD2A|nr:cytochrome ubiquinol oxidase subunit I [Ligilactobacillus salivarius]MBM6957221.1 cytochrome ubiquinol oxidase subunit I [Ligilactobacillus salivarius]
MSILSLARFQFAMTTIFHFFFVPFSIGMVFMVALMETCYVRTKNEAYKKMTKFWGNIFLLSFAVGVVTGLIQEFQFGMNWSDYSRFMGDIFGAPLAMEALLSFFIESTFIGLWMFTWDRVKPGLHLFFVWMVVIGTMTSALWILTANSFMQHPVGYAIRNGRAEMTSFSALLRNPQVWYEWGHVISGAIMMGGVVVAGMAAFRLLKRKSLSEVSKDIFKRSMRLGMIVSLLGSLSVMGVGDLQMKDLLHTQPMKFSAMEALYKDTGKSAGWTVVGIADTKNHKTNYTIEIPGMLSVLSYGKTTGSVKGMDTINKELQAKYGTKNNYYVPVNTLFWSFRVMAGFGALTFLVSALGLFFTRNKKASLFNTNWMLWVVALMTFTPFLANTCGWLITELGRYPWTVYGLFTIAQSVSPSVSATSLLISNILYFAIFTVLAIVMVGFVVKELRKGPDEASEPEFAKHGLDPFDKEAF